MICAHSYTRELNWLSADIARVIVASKIKRNADRIWSLGFHAMDTEHDMKYKRQPVMAI